MPKKTTRPSRRKNSPLMHGIVAFGAVALLLGSIATGKLRASLAKPDVSVEHLAVEHDAPLTMDIKIAEGNASALLELSHEGSGTSFVDVPLNWIFREVRNAAIGDVPADPPALDFRRWKLPAKAVLSFEVPNAHNAILIHNPSKTPLFVRWKRIDLATKTVESDSALLTEKTVQF